MSDRDRLATLLRDEHWEPDSNICHCGHWGGDHDLNNFCLICQPPKSDRFGSFSERELWDRAIDRLIAAGVRLSPDAPQPASDSAALREALALTRRNLQGILMAAHAAARRDHPENDDWPLGMALVEAHVVWEFDRRAALQAAAPPSAPQHWTCECGHGEEDHYFACVHHDSGCAVTITDAPQSAPDGEPSRED